MISMKKESENIKKITNCCLKKPMVYEFHLYLIIVYIVRFSKYSMLSLSLNAIIKDFGSVVKVSGRLIKKYSMDDKP